MRIEKNHNHQMESTTRQEDKDNVEDQQQSSDTVQRELTAGYVTGHLSQRPVAYPATPYFLGEPHVLLCQPTRYLDPGALNEFYEF